VLKWEILGIADGGCK